MLAVASALVFPASAASGKQRVCELTAVADVGTVFWRYDDVHYRSPRWSLGVAFRGEATTTVLYRDARLTRNRTLLRRRIWFPFRRERDQTLSFVQATEPGTLRARVTVRFGRGDDQCYFPPRTTVQIHPR